MVIKRKGKRYQVGFAKTGETCDHDSTIYFYIQELETEDDVFQLAFPKIAFIKGNIYIRKQK